MCGLIMDASISENVDLRSLEMALNQSSEDRGGHAYGLMWDGWKTFKAPTEKPLNIRLNSGTSKRLLRDNPRIVAGHTRFATHGTSLDNRNNHPHSGGNWSIMHNGVLYSRHKKQLTQCDSEYVLKSLIEHDCGTTVKQIGDAIGEMWAELDGAARLIIMHRKHPNRVWVINDFDSLYHIRTYSGHTLTGYSVASTLTHARLACSIHSCHTTMRTSVYEGKPDTLYCITVTNSNVLWTQRVLPPRLTDIYSADWTDYTKLIQDYRLYKGEY